MGELRKWVGRHKALALVLVGVMLLAVGVTTSVGLMVIRGEAPWEAATRDVVGPDLPPPSEAGMPTEVATPAADNEPPTSGAAGPETTGVPDLSASQTLDDLRREAATLWPVAPERVPAYDSWLARAEALVAGLDTSADASGPGFREQLQQLREQAQVRTYAEREADRQTHPLLGELELTQQTLEKLVEDLAAYRARLIRRPTPDQRLDMEHAEAQIDATRRAVTELELTVAERRTWTFDTREDTWRHNQLARLIGDIEALADPRAGLIEGVSPENGLGIRTRRELAATLAERTVLGADATRRWTEAIASIGLTGLNLAPQLGLLPLGRDPDSGLWEFWHVPSGAEPARDADGRLVMAADTGLVLVLIPGGMFWMGSQADDALRPNFDPDARSTEGPVHVVNLSPYVISKYEMTRGQWQRLTGAAPCGCPPMCRPEDGSSAHADSHPVEHVSWEESDRTLRRLGLALPTEAQWELAARGGTASPWSTGASHHSLAGAALLAGETDDPDACGPHAAVDSHSPNPFGLHNVHGNVREWCADAWGDGSFYAWSPRRDPVNQIEDAQFRVSRGGGFASTAAGVRSADRHFSTPTSRDYVLGLRPARALTRD